MPELFESLRLELEERLEVPAAKPPSTRSGQSIRIGKIATLIANNVKEETFFFIDEVPLNGKEFGSFSEGIAAVIITLANLKFHNAIFLLATISNPKGALAGVHAKLHERMRLLPITLWSEAEMLSLIKLITNLLPLHLSGSDKIRIIKAANGCPRALKMMLRNWCMFGQTSEWSLDRVISEATVTQHE